MSLRILFADDSMTAQNMGKRILSDAGYEVVTVSNGAAAVKKIKEQKPDIIILDIYMPGYSGLEVCDKVRTSHDTLRTPVLLTVGKMEPYKAEDANRVRADGVIIKPFEASDLLAVIKKLEERVVRKSAPVGEETVLLERPPDFAEFAPPTPENHTEVHPERQNTVQSTVDVPDNMATTAAFSDLLGMDSGHSLEPLPLPNQAFSAEFQVPPPAELEPTVPAVAEATPASEIEKESTPVPESASPAPEVDVAANFVSVPDTEPIPVYREPEFVVEETTAPAEPEKTAAPEAAEGPRAVETSQFIDPGLAIHVASFDPFTAKIDAEVQKIEAIVSASEARHSDVAGTKAASENGFEPPAAEAGTSADADFEARVAAAMSIYDQPADEKAELERAATESEIAHEAELPEEPASFEYSPPVNAPAVEIPVEAAAAERTEAVSETAPALEPTQPVQDIAPDMEPAVEVPQTANEAPISAGPVFVSSEATQVIPVYLEPPAEAAHAEAADEAPISAGPAFISSEATQVIPVYLEPAVESAQPEPAHHPEPVPVAEVPAEVPQEAHPIEEKVTDEVKAELPNLANSGTGFDTMMISAVADRILDRLKPQLIEEISRELKKKKQ